MITTGVCVSVDWVDDDDWCVSVVFSPCFLWLVCLCSLPCFALLCVIYGAFAWCRRREEEDGAFLVGGCVRGSNKHTGQINVCRKIQKKQPTPTNQSQSQGRHPGTPRDRGGCWGALERGRTRVQCGESTTLRVCAWSVSAVSRCCVCVVSQCGKSMLRVCAVNVVSRRCCVRAWSVSAVSRRRMWWLL